MVTEWQSSGPGIISGVELDHLNAISGMWFKKSGDASGEEFSHASWTYSVWGLGVILKRCLKGLQLHGNDMHLLVWGGCCAIASPREGRMSCHCHLLVDDAEVSHPWISDSLIPPKLSSEDKNASPSLILDQNNAADGTPSTIASYCSSFGFYQAGFLVSITCCWSSGFHGRGTPCWDSFSLSLGYWRFFLFWYWCVPRKASFASNLLRCNT